MSLLALRYRLHTLAMLVLFNPSIEKIHYSTIGVICQFEAGEPTRGAPVGAMASL